MNTVTAYAVSFGATFLAAWTGSAASIAARDFYQALVKPSWAPPAGVFGPVWTLLYLMMAVSGGMAMTAGGGQTRGRLLLFLAQLALNALWSWTFFAWKSGPGSLITIAALWITLVATTASFWTVSRVAGALLIPYLAWVTFAAALNGAIWRLNPGRL